MSQTDSVPARWLLEAWRKLLDPMRLQNAREGDLAHSLNAVLIFLLLSEVVVEAPDLLHMGQQFGQALPAVLVLGMIGLAYALNRIRQVRTAVPVTIGSIVIMDFLCALAAPGTHDFSLLYYLVVTVVISQLFLPFRPYLTTVALVMAGVTATVLLNSGSTDILIFAYSSWAFFTLAWYYRRPRTAPEQSTVPAPDAALLAARGRLAAQLALLEEVGRRITDSLDEEQILQNCLEAIVRKFKYAEAAICLLVSPDMLEVRAISGTEDLGFRVGFKQKVGQGIIGHVAETGEAYLCNEVSKDPYYFTLAPTPREGSALGIPILDNEQLVGVLYVESQKHNDFEQADVQTLQTVTGQVAISIQKARLYTRTREHLRAITALQSVSDAITSSLELDEILQTVIHLLKSAFGYTYITIFLLDGEMLRMGAQVGYPVDALVTEIPLDTGIVGRAARTRHTQFVRDVTTDPSYLKGCEEVRSEICVPLVRDNHVLGVLNVEATPELPLAPDDMDLLNTLAGPLAIAIDNARLHAQVKRMAWTDSLSGLANRRAFDDMIETEVARAQRYSNPLSLIIMDLDSFKDFNDKWGHLAGDDRLKRLAGMLRETVREPDVAARYGGEEFAVILPNTSKEGAIALAERIRAAAEAQSPHTGQMKRPIPGYTISLGVASYPQDALNAHELLLAADNAELTAKRLGKNRVFSA